jgi:hypothetical protein
MDPIIRLMNNCMENNIDAVNKMMANQNIKLSPEEQ